MTYSFEQLKSIKLKISEYENLNDKYKLFNDMINNIDSSINITQYKEVINTKYTKKNFNYNKNYNYQKNTKNNKQYNNKNNFYKLTRNRESNIEEGNQHKQVLGHSALRNRLNKNNKDNLLINGEINKLTESNIDTIIKNINESIYKIITITQDNEIIEKEEFDKKKWISLYVI